jgi:hypothetical protein
MYFEHGQGSIQAIFFSTFVKRKDPLIAIKDDEWSCDVIMMEKKKTIAEKLEKSDHSVKKEILYLSMLLLESFSKN